MILGITDTNHVLTIHRNMTQSHYAMRFSISEESNSDTDIYLTDIEGLQPVRHIAIALPDGKHLVEVSLSRTGRKLAWLLYSTSRSASLDRFLHLFPSHKSDPSLQTSLWISNIDGSEMHEVTTWNHHFHDKDIEIPQAVQWLPGDKEISFSYSDDIYVIRAD